MQLVEMAAVHHVKKKQAGNVQDPLHNIVLQLAEMASEQEQKNVIMPL